MARHTVKAEILKGDEVCKDLIYLYFFDTKPIYIITHACKDLSWKKTERAVYDSDKGNIFKI